MTHPMLTTASDRITELLAGHGRDGPARAVTVLPNAVTTIERAAALGAAPDQRTEHRTGYADGFEPETIHTRLGASTVDVPRARGVEFDPAAPETGGRRERALKPAVAAMDVRGIPTREVAAGTEQVCGLEVTGARVSRAAAALDAAPEEWRTRPLGETPYLILDARSEDVRHGGAVGSWAVPVAIGIGPQGKRSVPGTSASLSVAAVHGREFPAGLQARGLHGVEMVASGAHAGPRAAWKARMSGALGQRCRFHPAEDALADVPEPSMRKAAGASPRAVSAAPDRAAAERQLDPAAEEYRTSAPKLAAWPEADVPEGLTAFALPASHRRRLRTANMPERLNAEIRRRARAAGLFPHEASPLRPVGAVLMEISGDWETNRRYLTMGPE